MFFLSYDGLRAAQPEITKIERFGANDVLVHFETEPFKEYIVQSIPALHCGTNTSNCRNGRPTNWSNIYTAYALPYAGHHVAVDSRRTPRVQRFYRLRMTSQ